MTFDAIVADWNGTLISDRNEMPILKYIALGIAKSLLPFHPLKLRELLRAEQGMNELYRERRQDREFDYVRGMYEIYNKKIIEGIPMHVITNSVEKYAVKPEVQEKLDLRILRLMHKYNHENKVCGIFSAGYAHGIDRILTAAGYRKSFHFLIGDTLVENDGKALRFLLNIYRNKAPLLQKLLEERGIDVDKTAYIGDTEDDEDCFKLVKYPVVSFFAPDDFKEHCANKYCAFVPESEKDLMAFFKKNE